MQTGVLPCRQGRSVIVSNDQLNGIRTHGIRLVKVSYHVVCTLFALFALFASLCSSQFRVLRFSCDDWSSSHLSLSCVRNLPTSAFLLSAVNLVIAVVLHMLWLED